MHFQRHSEFDSPFHDRARELRDLIVLMRRDLEDHFVVHLEDEPAPELVLHGART